MIQLVHINSYKIDTALFSNLLHDPIIEEVENNIAKYVGAKYCVLVSTATNAIFLCLKSLKESVITNIPSLITTRFLNYILFSNCSYRFLDDVSWVGGSYILYKNNNFKIIDSAQKINPNQFKEECNDNDILIFSHYPTKPIGSLSGSCIVSNDKNKIDWIRQAAYFGESFSTNSWEAKTDFKGWQMHSNSVNAWIINENFKKYPEKRAKLDYVRERYNVRFNTELKVTTNSYHLYRIRTKNNDIFVKKMYLEGIICGIHYKPAHLNPLYGKSISLPNSERDGKEVVSIPFHENLTDKEIDLVIKNTMKYERINI